MEVIVRLENVSKSFNNNKVIDNINLEVYKGEFITLLGPSGCGKTTVLRMISGLEIVTEGKIFIDDKDVTNVDATKRETNTIFQNFALFPHLSVFENIAFGLKIKKMPKKKIKTEVKKAIKLVNLEGLEDRKPAEISGGQQQRVAIARGIVMNPKVLLLDEPLCSLDLKLKKKMQIELKKLQQKLGITFIYVTHDQDEALTMSDRIAIINNHKIEQIDTPENIYRKPKTTFVADFIGESNILKGIVKQNEIIFENFSYRIKNKEFTEKDKVTVIIRPEVIKLSKRNTKSSLKGQIVDYIYDGEMSKFEVKVDDIVLKVHNNNMEEYQNEDFVNIQIEEDHLIIIGDKNESKK